MTALYAPGTEETDPKKQNRALQLYGGAIAANATNVATNTANIATNTANITSNTTNISALQTKTTGYEAAWTTYTPTITSTGGTPTTVTAAGSYLVIGKIVHFIVLITVSNIGTSTGKWNLPLPTGTAKRAFVASGAEIAASGKMISYTVAAAAGTGTVQAFDNSTSLLVNGYSLNLAGIYELT